MHAGKEKTHVHHPPQSTTRRVNQRTNANSTDTQLVPLVRWIPGTWTSNILWIAYLPLQLRFQVRFVVGACTCISVRHVCVTAQSKMGRASARGYLYMSLFGRCANRSNRHVSVPIRFFPLHSLPLYIHSLWPATKTCPCTTTPKSRSMSRPSAGNGRHVRAFLLHPSVCVCGIGVVVGLGERRVYKHITGFTTITKTPPYTPRHQTTGGVDRALPRWRAGQDRLCEAGDPHRRDFGPGRVFEVGECVGIWCWWYIMVVLPYPNNDNTTTKNTHPHTN